MPASYQDCSDVAARPQTSRQPASRQAFSAQTVKRPQTQRKTSVTGAYQERQASPPAQVGAQDLRRVRGEDIDSDAEDERRRRLKERYSVQRGPEPQSTPPTRPSVTELFPPPRPEPVQSTTKPMQFDGPPTSEQIRATKSIGELPKYVDSSEEDDGGCFGLFKRKRGETVTQLEKTPTAKTATSRELPTNRPGGGGAVPGTDAPVSAVNAGDREVLVECGKSKTMFPVTRTTTPVDIIKGAAGCMNECIDVKSALLLEYFGTVGVQRPLRRYEHIRHVMNSWDTDRQNRLLLVDPGTGSSEAELSLAGAPRIKPGDDSWLLSVSQKVGKWDKRMITLKSEGQITMQKHANKPDEQVNICHLSDFDIYTPTQEKVRKKIKPPKKICFAIKSQQKTSMFESTQNFVHFFCTNDRPTADGFYAAVQEWRSWYLVNVMGEGTKPQSLEKQKAEEVRSGSDGVGKNHRTGNSYDSRYQLGSFRPLIDIDQFGKRPGTSKSIEGAPPTSNGFTKSSSQFDTTISPERRTSTAKRKQNSPGSVGNRAQLAEDEPLVNLGRRPSTDRRRPSMDQKKASLEEFLGTGLLGRTYSQRQREYTDRDNQRANAYTAGPNLLINGGENREEDYPMRRSLDGGPRRTHSTRAQHAHKDTGSGDLQRANSRAKDMPKPLVDLTPQYRDPPQHVKKGKGYNADSIGRGRLIDAATSPEDPLGIPPSTDWRGRNASGSHSRTHSLSRSKPTGQSVRRPHTSRSPEATNAFTGEGLLAGPQAQQGWGGGERGRGVIDGSRAKGPMVDLTEPSVFVPGSLINKLEQEQHPPAPIIERSREED